MGYQFIHIDLFSRKGNKGRSTSFVFAEASRQPEASLHVENPSPPEVIFGCSIAKLQELHDDLTGKGTIVTLTGQTRHIRKDQNTLACIVASHPSTIDQVKADRSTAQQVLEWEKLTIDWLRTKYGDDLRTVVRHTDESHAHLHCYLLATDGAMIATRFHPGQTAKNLAMKETGIPGQNRSLRNRLGDEAYKSAMRTWQDEFHSAVGARCGLTRLGPARRRLTSQQWKAEKVQASSLRQTVSRARSLHKRAAAYLVRNRAMMDEQQRAIEDARQHAEDILEAALKVGRAFAERFRQANLKLQDVRNQGRTSRKAANAIRNFLDGLRVSSIRKSIRSEFEENIAGGKARERAMKERLREQEYQVRQAERKLGETVSALRKVTFERDQLTMRKRQITPIAPSLSPRTPLIPKIPR